MKIRLIAIATLALLSCGKEDVPGDCVEKINPNVVCTEQYDPVCGCNIKPTATSAWPEPLAFGL